MELGPEAVFCDGQQKKEEMKTKIPYLMATIAGALLLGNSAQGQLTAYSTLNLDNLGDGSYSSTVGGNNYSGSITGTSVSLPNPGWQYTYPGAGYFYAHGTAGNVILADGIYALGDVYFPQQSDDVTPVIIYYTPLVAGTLVATVQALPGNSSDPVVDSSTGTWTYDPTSGPGYITADAPPPGGAPTAYDTTYNFTVVPEPTTVLAGVLTLLPFGASGLRILRKRQAA